MNLGGAYLTYCTNIHPGKTWGRTRDNLLSHCPAIKAALSPQSDFGLGVWLSAQAAEGLKSELDEFKKHLRKLGMFVFSINAFPYGEFHHGPVKEKVYTPDWSTPERLAYTKTVASLLAELLPENTCGSISTLPLAYGKLEPQGARENLLAAAAHLERIEKETGRRLALAIEPEPDCFLETTEECIRFFRALDDMDTDLTRRYLGVCLDTCHMALQFENPTESVQKLSAAGIQIPKIQLSAALKITDPQGQSLEPLHSFDDGIYLHQTRVRRRNHMVKFPDLPQALASPPSGEWRVHFHVPLHYAGETASSRPAQNHSAGTERAPAASHHHLNTTSDLLDSTFFHTARMVCPHFEIETYSFDVMPGNGEDVRTSIRKEFEFVLRHMPPIARP